MAGQGHDRNDEPLHAYDLPQLYTRPSAGSLLSTLRSLILTPTTFAEDSAELIIASPTGITTYLTQIISSSLSWIDESIREDVWELAARRLSERSGRSAAPAMTREFKIDENLTISMHEPSLTGDMLGLKTWSSSLMLAKKLQDLKAFLPGVASDEELRVLELGAGTGLVGIAAACKWSTNAQTAYVTLSDLPELVPNLRRNVEMNDDLIKCFYGRVRVCTLDWADEENAPVDETAKFPVIVAADPLYSPEHPVLLVNAVGRWLRKDRTSRFVVTVPLREGYASERTEMTDYLLARGLELETQGEEIGFDDWQGSDGQRQEVRYAWSVWKAGLMFCVPEATAESMNHRILGS